jgi:hypothetical protein
MRGFRSIHLGKPSAFRRLNEALFYLQVGTPVLKIKLILN